MVMLMARAGPTGRLIAPQWRQQTHLRVRVDHADGEAVAAGHRERGAQAPLLLRVLRRCSVARRRLQRRERHRALRAGRLRAQARLRHRGQVAVPVPRLHAHHLRSNLAYGMASSPSRPKQSVLTSRGTRVMTLWLVCDFAQSADTETARAVEQVLLHWTGKRDVAQRSDPLHVLLYGRTSCWPASTVAGACLAAPWMAYEHAATCACPGSSWTCGKQSIM